MTMLKGVAIGAGVVILLGSLFAIYFWAFDPPEQEDNNQPVTTDTTADNENCSGTYIDTHTHFDEDDYVDLILPRLQENGVGCAVVFRAIEADDIDDGVEYLTDLEGYKGYFLPFFNLDPETPENLTEPNLEAVTAESPVAIRGLGEYAFYQDPLIGDNLTANPWPAVFDYAGKNGLWIMIHLTPSQQQQLPIMLKRYPKTKVLVHGTEIGPSLWKQWLVEYPNLYYTLDTANILREGMLNLMFPGQQPSDGNAEDFLISYAQNKKQLLSNAVKDWLPVIKAAPTKVFWGTDVAAEWHFDKRVYDKLIELTEEFVAELPANLRDGYRYDNTAAAFGL